MANTERDFPKGHPKAADYDPTSPDAIEWARIHVHPLGERDFPVDHVKAVDTKGNTNHIPVRAGIDPMHPEREEHTGASPEIAAARHAQEAKLSGQAKETPTLADGRVDTGRVAHEAALRFLMEKGHTYWDARNIVAKEGPEKVLAGKATL
jgi:hypothetical protein